MSDGQATSVPGSGGAEPLRWKQETIIPWPADPKLRDWLIQQLSDDFRGDPNYYGMEDDPC